MIYPRITTTLRAIWDDSASAQLTIRQRAVLWLSKRRVGHEYYVAVSAKRSFWRKKVLIQDRKEAVGRRSRPSS